MKKTEQSKKCPECKTEMKISIITIPVGPVWDPEVGHYTENTKKFTAYVCFRCGRIGR